jgi:hypothetical protein
LTFGNRVIGDKRHPDAVPAFYRVGVTNDGTATRT